MQDRTMRLMDQFRTWLDERALGRLSEPAGSVLTARRDYAGRSDPTCWHSGYVHALMASIVPARMADTGRLAEHGVAALDAFLDFLEGTGRLHPGSMHVRALKRELARVAETFQHAMADPRGWRMAKTLYQTTMTRA